MQIQTRRCLEILSFVTVCLALAGCGAGSESVENKLCNDEITRKVQGSDMTIENVEFSSTTKDTEGNDIINGNVTIVQGGSKKAHAFSCVMQGSGADAVVMRADFQ
jgi:hypothetical protein